MIEIIDLSKNENNPRLDAILNRSLALDGELLAKTSEIIEMIRRDGDRAICDLTLSFDGIRMNPSNLRVDPDLIKNLASQVDSQLLEYIRRAIENVRIFHEKQIESSWEFTDSDGAVLGQRLRPLERVGLYVPGGKAAYPSTVIMNAVPAIVAGVNRIAVATPPANLMSNPVIAAALHELQLSEVYAVGGAQAVAALAYGTETVPRVDKIVGPGNAYVAAAKKLVYGIVDIDSLAGPSEIVVMADAGTPPPYVAADMLSQAEHDADAAAILITTSQSFARVVDIEIERQLTRLPRREIAESSLKRYGAIFVVESIRQGCELINRIAPEHVELMIDDAESAAESILNAGAIFIGSFSCESAGDYIAGPNHVLPTGGAARFSSPLGVYDFLKRTNIIKYNKEKLEKTADAIIGLAECEGLSGHANAVMVRFKEKSKTTVRIKR